MLKNVCRVKNDIEDRKQVGMLGWGAVRFKGKQTGRWESLQPVCVGSIRVTSNSINIYPYDRRVSGIHIGSAY